MAQKIFINRTAVDGKQPTGLSPGELSIEMGNPTRLWVGVPAVLDPAEKKLLFDSSDERGFVFVGDAPPPAPAQGDLWWESDTGIFWMWYVDPNTTQWVQVNGISAPGTVGGGGGGFDTGTAILFHQNVAPTGWTKDTTYNDRALRITSGTITAGGVQPSSACFARTVSDSAALDTNTLPYHQHQETCCANYTPADQVGSEIKGFADSTGPTSSSSYTIGSGAGWGHSHGMDIRVQYVDCVICVKD
jgi:hypothetical protein